MKPDAVKPTRVSKRNQYARGPEDYVETHPAFGTIGAHRVSAGGGGGYALFGSDFRHRHFITITIGTADHERMLNNDWIHGHQDLIEVALSEAQWATFVSTLNMGTGVPCTIQRLKGELIPDIDPIETRKEEYASEVEAKLEDATSAIADTIAAINATNLSAKVKREITFRLEAAAGKLKPHLDWVASQYEEHAEKVVEHAKVEIEAYLMAAVQRAGLQALGAPEERPFELSSGEEPQD